MVRPIIEIDQASVRAFQSSLRLYQKATRKSSAEVVNHAAMQLALRAMWHTKSADKSDIESLREHYATQFRGKKRLLKKPKQLYRATTRGFVVYLSKLRRMGKDPKNLTTAQLMDGAAKMVNRRIGSIAFIRAGWIAAIRRLASTLNKPTGSLVRARAGRGSVRVARESENPFSEIINRSNSPAPGADAALLKYGGAGLAAAIPGTTADMMQYATKKLEEAKKSSFGS